MKGQARISSIYHQGPNPRVSPMARAEEARRAAWRDHGMLLIDPTEIDDDWLRQALLNLGAKLHGPRPARR